MTIWQPGQPVRTENDVAAWKEWRKVQKREAQRERRRTNPRIDYYPDAEAAHLIYRMASEGTYSDTLNRIVAEWQAHCATGIK